MTVHWPDLDDRLDCDAGWRQRFLAAAGSMTCQPIARPVFHCLSNAVFGPDGALARLQAGAAEAIYLEAGGVGVVVARDGDGRAMAVAVPGARRPATTAELLALSASSPHRAPLTAEPTSWPSRLPLS